MALSQPQPLSPPPTSPNATLNNFTVEFAVPAPEPVLDVQEANESTYIY